MSFYVCDDRFTGQRCGGTVVVVVRRVGKRCDDAVVVDMLLLGSR